MRKRHYGIGLGIAVLAVALVWWRYTPPTVGIAALAAQSEEFMLDNGMRWLLVDRGDAPVVTALVQVRAGGVDEPEGKAGIAHMFEHMAFKGSPDIGTTDYAAEQQLLTQIQALDAQAAAAPDAAARAAIVAQRADVMKQADALVAPNEVWRLLHEQGAAVINASTSKDVTTYYVDMPNSMLGLWTYVASEMIGRPVLRQFYQERDVVMEERRTSVDNSVSGRVYEALLRTAFTTSPYRHMPIGSMREIESLTMADAQAFYAAHYRPDAMFGVIVGRFDHAAVKRDLTRFFGRMPTATTPLSAADATATPEPAQTSARRVEISFDAAPVLMMAYHKPTAPQRDDYVFDILAQLLCQGDNSLLVQRLQKELQLVRSISCTSGTPGARRDNLFLISAQPLGDHTTAEVEAAIEHELAALRDQPVDAALVARAVKKFRAMLLWELNSNSALARQIAHAHGVTGDWRYLLTYLERIGTITADDVRSVAQRYLQPTQRTVAVSTR